MVARFGAAALDVQDPAFGALAVTPNDSTELDTTRGIYVGGDGNVNVEMAAGGTVVFIGVVAGTVLPICVTKVLLTSTTATNIVALY